MSGIRSKDTRHEVLIRKALHAAGFRYRLHRRDIPGTPDIALPKYRAAVFVHGCFWHGHDCHLFKQPSTRPEFWLAKITRNRNRDSEVRTALLDARWRRLTVWDCAFRGKAKLDFDDLIGEIAGWIVGDATGRDISGNQRLES